MSEIYSKLKAHLGLTEEQADEMFSISESDTEYMLTCGWLETDTFKAMQQLVEAAGGSYTAGTKTSPTTFTIPKKEPQSEFSIVPTSSIRLSSIQTRVKPECQLEELTDSIKAYGVLEPILVRPIKDGYEVVAGGRRLKAARTAGLQTIPVIIKELSDVEAFVIQLSENIQRRDLTEEEKTMALAELAEKTGWNATEISKKINMSYSWVAKYLPSEFKDETKAEAGQIGGVKSGASRREAKRLSAQEEIAKEIVACEVCGREVHRSRLKIRGGKLTCPICLGEKLEKKKKARPQREKTEEPPTPPKEYKPKETAAFRRARMHPQHSKMEQALLVKLHQADIHPVRDREFCLQSTTPDFYFPQLDKAIYIDGPVHKNREARDDKIRETLASRHELDIVSIKYEEATDKEVNRVFQQIREEVTG